MKEKQEEDHPGQSFVKVTIDGRITEVHRGSHRIAELKQLLSVDPTYALDLDVNGTPTPLADEDRLTVKGDEILFSHPRTGASS